MVFILLYFFFLTTPGIRLMGAARLDGMQRVGKEARLLTGEQELEGWLAEEDSKQGREEKKGRGGDI